MPTAIASGSGPRRSASILAIVEFEDEARHRLHYVQRPFEGKGITSDFSGATVNFPMVELLASAEQIA
jgi:hypothetical protein